MISKGYTSKCPLNICKRKPAEYFCSSWDCGFSSKIFSSNWQKRHKNRDIVSIRVKCRVNTIVKLINYSVSSLLKYFPSFTSSNSVQSWKLHDCLSFVKLCAFSAWWVLYMHPKQYMLFLSYLSTETKSIYWLLKRQNLLWNKHSSAFGGKYPFIATYDIIESGHDIPSKRKISSRIKTECISSAMQLQYFIIIQGEWEMWKLKIICWN